MKHLALSRVVLASFGLAALFFVLFYSLRPDNLIILLNSVFIGSMVSVVVAYHELIWQAIRGDGVYDRIRQMTLGFALTWVVIVIGASTSIYIRLADLPATAYTSVAIMRYLSIIAALLQVTAPDFGLGLFHGRDRKILTASLGFGLITAMVFIVLQSSVKT
jgi:hypothetical protein